MKKNELQAQAEKCLALYEKLLSRSLEQRDFGAASIEYQRLSGALYILQRLDLIPDAEAAARDRAAFERYLDAKYADPKGAATA